ncbi:DDB1- and CUL4-associated factor 6-like [Haematobia irritans]|uniref:DDB1- and CUL4-associated factor 6-like n=1 Tax=Haematobia irritans TaxID=7368 RepID=UPI003F4FC239
MPRDTLSRNSVFRSILQRDHYNPHVVQRNLIASAKDSLDYVQRLGLMCRLPIHSGCVNTVHWNVTGEYLITGSDDQFIAVTNPNNQEVLLKYKTAHRANIFSARFMPQSNDQAIVSCSGDGIVLHTELLAPYIKRVRKHIISDEPMPSVFERISDNDTNVGFFNCHKSGTTYEVMTVPTEPRSFMSCGEDGTVRLFDLRKISSCHKTCCKDNILIFSPSAINAMDLAPISSNYVAVGSSDAIVRIYDRRYLSVIDFSDSSIPTTERHTRPVKAYPIPLPTNRQYRITCIRYSPEESELLVSYSSEYLYLFDLQNEGVDVCDLSKKGRSFHQDATPPPMTAEQVTRRLRLRGDWSDTGPDARPERENTGRGEVGQVRPQLQANIMNRMTEVISRMLNDPRTRMGLTNQMQETLRETAQEGNETLETRDVVEESRPSTSSAWRRAAASTLAANHSSALENQSEAANNCPSRSQSADGDDVEMSNITNQTPSSRATDNTEFQDDSASLNQELADLEMETKEVIFDYLRMKYTGHRNARTMIKEATFWGNNYVMSGSDCGHIFTWDRRTGKLVMLMQADQHVVNCLQPHPELPYLASSGIDYDVKIWAPILNEKSYNEEEAEDLMKRNAIMLEQTKDTITVPAAFMIRMLACIHSLRNRERNSNSNDSNVATATLSSANNEDSSQAVAGDNNNNSSTTNNNNSNSSNQNDENN